jgi:hypothetical protein
VVQQHFHPNHHHHQYHHHHPHLAHLTPPHLQQQQHQIRGLYPPSVLANMSASGYCPSPPTIPSLHDSITSYDIPNGNGAVAVEGLVGLMGGHGPYKYAAHHGVYGGSSPGLLGYGASGTTMSTGAGGVGVNGTTGDGGRERFDKDLPLLANPLPEPPRESVYEPAELNSDYWTKYARLAQTPV